MHNDILFISTKKADIEISTSFMTPDELKSLPKGTFVVMKTGFYPMKVKLKLFFDWGITFEEPYTVRENGNRVVCYANKREIINGILVRYPIEIEGEQPPQEPPKTSKGGNSPSPLRTAPGGENEPFEDMKESFGLRLTPKNAGGNGGNNA